MTGESAAPQTGRSWLTHGAAGSAGAIGLVASGPVAILAGFSLAAVVTNLTEIDDRTLWLDASALMFALGILLLLGSLRLLIAAQHWTTSPSELLDRYPEATLHIKTLELIRDTHYRHVLLYDANRERANSWTYLGVALSLLGLGSWVVHAAHGRIVLIGLSILLAMGALVAVLNIVGRPRTLFPDEMNWYEVFERRDRRARPARSRKQHERVKKLWAVRDGVRPAPMSVETAELYLRPRFAHQACGANVAALAEAARRRDKEAVLLKVLEGVLPHVPHVEVMPWGVRMFDAPDSLESRLGIISVLPTCPGRPEGLFFSEPGSVSRFIFGAGDLKSLTDGPVTHCIVCGQTKIDLLDALASG